MTAFAGTIERSLAVPAVLVGTALAALACGVVVGLPFTAAVGIAGALGGIGLVIVRPTIEWRVVLGVLLVVILFIPIRRYRMPGDLPFELEPYRIVVALVLGAWLLALLADPRVRLRRTGFEGPIFLIVFAALASAMANPARVAGLTSFTVKALTFFLSFVLVFYLVATVLRTRRDIDAVVKTLVAGGAIVAVLAIVESRTGFSIFDDLAKFVPVIEPVVATELARGVRLRAYGPAEHPIALSAALVLLVPLAIYLAHRVGRVWWLAVAAITLGALSSLSRTGVVMLAVTGVGFLILKPVATRRVWPLAIPLLVAVHFVMPGALGTFKQTFFPEGGVIADQQKMAGSCSSAGRVADLGPSLDEAAKNPAFGVGYGTRITTFENGVRPNACILDNQWLGTLLETGLLGVVAWVWLFARVIRRSGKAAKEDDSPESWLLAAVTISAMAFAVGMFLFDAFGFVQAIFLLWVVLGLAAAALRLPGWRPRHAAVAPG